MNINIPENVKYLSEYIKDLPDNCILSKGKVGAGGTSIAINNNVNYVIAVPFVSLIENKMQQHENIFGLYGKTTVKALINYLNDDKIPVKKIMVTYDSLQKVVDNIDTKSYKILIDEYHLLFTSYSFRYDAVKCVLNNYTKFKSYCFMTATILEEEFILKELENIPIISYDWTDTAEVTVHSMKCKGNVIPTVVNIINKYLNEEIDGNAYFFVNSVSFISNIINILGLDNTNTRAIWSTHNKMKMSIKNSLTTDPPKKINFFTSKCFEGVDLYDENARLYIVSDDTKASTLIDISTSLQQICGRVRDTKYWKNVAHIFTSTRYDVDMSLEDYKKEIETYTKDTLFSVSECNNLSENTRKSLEIGEYNNYLNKRDNWFFCDENMAKIDLYNYKLTKCLYKARVNLTKEYQKNNFQVVEHSSFIKEKFPINNIFKDVVIYCKESEDEDYLKWAYNKYDFLKEAITHLGYDKIEKLQYNSNLIKKTLLQFSNTGNEDKIKKMLDMDWNIQKGMFVSNDKLKEMFKEIYNNLSIKKAPKASDITKYYKTKESFKTIKEKNKRGYIII